MLATVFICKLSVYTPDAIIRFHCHLRSVEYAKEIFRIALFLVATYFWLFTQT